MSDRFSQVVSHYGPKLQAEFGFSVVQGCGPWGNAGRETGGFRFYQEVGSGSNSGGRSWFQWSGARRVAFLAWCKTHRIDPKSDEAGYGYLCFELHGSYRNVVTALKRCKTLEASVQTFERLYEAAGVKAMADRVSWGRKALAILSPGHPAAAVPAPKKAAAPMAKKAKPKAAAVKRRTAPVAHSLHHAKAK